MTFRLVVDCCSFVVVVRAVVVAFDVEMVAYLALDHVDSSYLWGEKPKTIQLRFDWTLREGGDRNSPVPGFMPGLFFDIG